MSVLSDEKLKEAYWDGFYSDGSSTTDGLRAVADAAIAADRAARAEPVAWKHDCAALLTNDVELWIENCPHCGKPRQPAPPAAPVIPQCFMTAESGNGAYRLVMKFQSLVDLHKAHDAMIAMLAAAPEQSCSQAVEKSTRAGAHVDESVKSEHVEAAAPVRRATSKPMALPVNRFDTASNRPKRPGPWSEKPFKR